MEITAYTGGTLSLPNFAHPAVINLAGVKAMHGEQLPFLRDHKQDKAVGHGKPTIGKKHLQHSGKLSIAGDERDKIVAANREGFSWQASVGGRIPEVRKHVQTIAAGERVRVNGRTFDGPISVINAFIWKETSFVAVGADEGRASASIAAAQSSRVNPMNEFDKWLEASGVNSDELSDAQVANLQAAYDAMQAPKAKVTTPADIDVERIVASATTAAVQAAQQQSQRDRRIDRLFASYSDTTLEKDAVDQLRASVESGEITEEKAHLDLLLAHRGKGNTRNANIGGSSVGDNYALELEAAVGRTAGLADEQIHASLVQAGAPDDLVERSVERSRSKPKGLKSIILAICRQEGHHADEVDDDAIRCAMRASERDLNIKAASGGWSTVALPGILSRIANKAMLAAYAEADGGGVATQIASTTSTRDFKKFNRYRMTEVGVMEVLPASGEIKHGTLTEEGFENQVQTYGKMLSLTRQMMRNDDLDAFMQIPRMIGRMGRHALEQAAIETLVNASVGTNSGFFHSSAVGNQTPNYIVGASTALAFDTLEPAYTAFLNQVDADGKPIGIDPALLLVGNSDIIQARKLYTDTQYRFTAASTTETINNQWEGMFRPIKSAYLHILGTTPLTTAWYLLANPSTDISAVQIAFLDGVQTPTINQSETAFNTLGMQMRGYFDFGCALQDGRAAVKVKGAA